MPVIDATHLYDLLLAHQRAHTLDQYYYCWRSAQIYNHLKNKGREDMYHDKMWMVRERIENESPKKRRIR